MVHLWLKMSMFLLCMFIVCFLTISSLLYSGLCEQDPAPLSVGGTGTAATGYPPTTEQSSGNKSRSVWGFAVYPRCVGWAGDHLP